MARTNIPVVPPLGSYPTPAALAGGAAMPSLTSIADPTDRSVILPANDSVGKVRVLAHNSDTVPHTITFTSVPDSLNRTGDIVQVMAAGDIAVFGPFKSVGWAQPTTNLLFINVTDSKIRMAPIQDP